VSWAWRGIREKGERRREKRRKEKGEKEKGEGRREKRGNRGVLFFIIF